MKKKIVVFTGAGISAESGITTFRDANGLWYNYKVEDVASLAGWKKDRDNVLKFYNERRAQLKDVHPNAAHQALAKLEEHFDVTVVTQNVDDLHERGGSTNILHLHGELLMGRSSMNPLAVLPWTGDMTSEHKHEDGSQIRPHIVWFGEYPYHVQQAKKDIEQCDYLLIIGTSLQIGYTLNLLAYAPEDAKIIYIDPNPSMDLSRAYFMNVEYIKGTACEAVPRIIEQIINNQI